MRAANLGLRFLLELGALAAVGYWGWRPATVCWAGCWPIGAIAAVIAVWALFVSPKHTIEISKQVAFAIELAVWVAAVAALYATDHEALALAFAAISMASGALNYAWR